ncbi:acyltransferase [Collimonas sp.]|jgi:peptidoglycan/LPS O-acetylase OafA/YrhL|uniref:acyltransferase family protein n=1 Tax=Collimonas sp. TaxID=1963772 RepID=UPI002B84A128|nr:acyltransferase [Collimonas sp.]HWW99456.1 acyltransferase [Collimonas sp.]
MDREKIDAITGLRGLAALLVVYGHSLDWFALPWKNHLSGEVGVAIFFSLSGFLMAYLYLGKRFSAINAVDYAISRFSRIAPAYLVILLLSFFIYVNVDPNFVYGISAKNILRHIFFSGNVSVFWSITPEVEFYFLFVLAWAAGSRYLNRSDLTGLLFLVLGSMILLSYRDIFPGTFIGSKLHYFLFGMIAGLMRSHIQSQDQNRKLLAVLHALSIAAIIAMTAGWLPLPFSSNQDFYNSILTAVFGAFLVFSLSFPSAVGNLFFANRAMVLCGEWSFSIYLLHMPLIYLFKKIHPEPFQIFILLPLIVLVLFFSWLNFQLIERPGARLIRSVGAVFKRKFLAVSPAAASPRAMPLGGDTR